METNIHTNIWKNIYTSAAAPVAPAAAPTHGKYINTSVWKHTFMNTWKIYIRQHVGTYIHTDA